MDSSVNKDDDGKEEDKTEKELTGKNSTNNEISLFSRLHHNPVFNESMYYTVFYIA